MLPAGPLRPTPMQACARTGRRPCSVRRMLSVGIVLSAGGMLGDPWHSGVLAAIMRDTGFDARDAALIVGTSAGSTTAVGLRAGASPLDRAAHHLGEPMSAQGEEVLGRIHTPWSEIDEGFRLAPMSPRMSIRAIWPPWEIDPIRFAFGVLPRGRRRADSLSTRISELHPAPWTSQPTWVVAVRSDDGNRVVFGRDDITVSIGDAVQASCAVPGVYRPKKIGRHEYVDGGLHSSTNADLVAPLGFDVVIVSSAMTAAESTRSWISDPVRAWFSRKLDSEVDAIRRAGTPVLVVQPDAVSLPRLSRNSDDARSVATKAGVDAAGRALDAVGGSGIHELLAD